jgi:hypothetical protein
MSEWTYKVYVDSTVNPSNAELGHAYIKITSPYGDTTTVGFYPDVSQPGTTGLPGSSGGHALEGPGIVRDDSQTGTDANNNPTQHHYDFETESKVISEQTAQRMLDYVQHVGINPGVYGVLGNNCVQFVEDLMIIAGDRSGLMDTVPPFALKGQLWFEAKWREFMRDISNIFDDVNSSFTAALNFVIPRRDPLVLDLDGDGLELIAANGTVLFDHNADGIKTGTGWSAANDGLLVRDLNGNGLIDYSRELFGIDTIKSNSTFATQGFDALKDLDSNLDGFITSADAAFAELKVWQDLNQDGISQAGELKTLSQWGITSISATGSTTGPQAGQVPNGNRVDFSATVTQNDSNKSREQITRYAFNSCLRMHSPG